jgi:hypothetical protein
MFTQKIISKEFENGVLVLGVEFTDGVKVITEAVKPQDEVGFKYWLRSRLASLNSLTDLEQVSINDSIDLSEPDTRTQAEIDKALWFAKYGELERLEEIALKGFLTGVKLTALNNKISTVKSYLDTNAKVEYLDFI